MNKLEKVIKGLRYCTDDALFYGRCPKDCPYPSKEKSGESCVERLRSEALNLLEAQEPIKPIPLKDVTPTRIDTIVFKWQCRNCYHFLIEGWVACPICGMGVKWNE